MVYIYKKTIGAKNYYYLRASVRKNGKQVVKDIAYLGNSLEDVQKALGKLPLYEKEIRKTYRTLKNFIESNRYIEKVKALKIKHDPYLDQKLIDVEACKLHYNAVFQKEDELTQQEVYKQFIIEFTFNTTSLEGNTITLKEAHDLLEESLTPKGKTLREIYDVQNTERMFSQLLVKQEKISHDLIIEIHKKLMQNIDVRLGYRTRDVRVVHARFRSSPAEYVKTDMDLLLAWYEKNKNVLHPLALAAIFHHKFERIHPFMDGNGRTGRILMNYILIKHRYPPIIIHKKLRDFYLDALKDADESPLTKSELKYYKELVHTLADELAGTYWNVFLV